MTINTALEMHTITSTLCPTELYYFSAAKPEPATGTSSTLLSPIRTQRMIS